MLLAQDYVPVVSPVALDASGAPCVVDADAAAAELAVALAVPKLIYLAAAPGILEAGELVSELSAGELERKQAQLALPIAPPALLRALAGGIGRIHVIDGRTPHAIIAELFTDRGVGTLVTP